MNLLWQRVTLVRASLQIKAWRIASVVLYRKVFSRAHCSGNYPLIEAACAFSRSRNIVVGTNVIFLRGATVLADRVGQIRIGDNSTICRYAVFQSVGGTIDIGRNSTIGDFCSLYGQGGLSIGDDVMIAAGVRLVPSHSQHSFDDPNLPVNQQLSSHEGIIIGHGVWIGANACALDGVSIGDGAVIGAGSIVTRDVPPFAVAAGVPARVIRYRAGTEKIGKGKASNALC